MRAVSTSRWKKGLFAVLVAAAAFAGLEGALRVALPVARRVTMPDDMVQAHLAGGEAFRYDPDLGWYWKHLGDSGAAANAYGFRRAKAMTFAKPEGTVRVVTLGDSQTFGAGLPPDQTYAALAEERLGAGWEVLNAGLSGYRSLNVLRLLQLRIEAFRPDAVVIDCMPHDSPRDDGRLAGRPLNADWTHDLRAALWTSRTYWATRMLVEKLDPRRPRWLDQAPEARPGGSDQGNHDLIAAWGRERGVAVLFVDYPVMNPDDTLGCMTLPGELPAGSTVVPACAALAATGRPARDLFQDNNHLTLEGSRIVGDALAASLRAWRGALHIDARDPSF